MANEQDAEKTNPQDCLTETGSVENCCGQRTTVREEKLRSALIKRLNCVEGQVRGIKGMIEKDAYCDDVLNQIAAARAAMTSISKMVLENHIHGCLVKKIRNGEDEVVDELLRTIGRLL